MRGRHEEGAAARPSTRALRAVVLCCCCATASGGSCSHSRTPPGGATWNADCPWQIGNNLGCHHTCTATCPVDSSVQTAYYCNDGSLDPHCWGNTHIEVKNGDGDNLHCPCAPLGAPPDQATWVDPACSSALQQHGQSCTAQCWQGHHLTGGSETYKCTDGVWRDGELACAPDPCPFDALTPKENVNVSGENGGSCVAGRDVASGESCSAECSHGYFKSGGSTQYTCREGLWTPAAVNTECTADGTCEATDPNIHGEWAEGCIPHRDQVCESQCKEGYQRRSEKVTLQYQCTIDDQGVGTWMPVGFNKSADTACVACWDQQANKPAHCYCTDPPMDNAQCADMEGHRAGATDSECKPGCVPGYHHEEEQQPFRCTVVNGTGQWVGGSIECLEGNTDSSGVRPEHAVLITLGVLAVLAIVVYKCLWPRFCAHKSSAPRSLLRESILGSANMPDRQLAAKCAGRFHLECVHFD
jgi:hypothetical protein